jgi:hypothetical protein
MRAITSVLVLSCGLAASQEVLKVPLTESRHAVRATTPYGEALLPAVRVQLEIRGGRGKDKLGDMVVVYDPQTRHYLWLFRPVESSDLAESFISALLAGDFAIYSGADGIAEFDNLGALFVQEHTESADSLDAAQSASIDALKRGLPVLERNGYDQGLKQVVFLRPNALDNEFYCPDRGDRNPYCKPNLAKFISIARVREGWRVVMRGSWDQEVILDPKFNVVSLRRLPEAAQ